MDVSDDGTHAPPTTAAASSAADASRTNPAREEAAAARSAVDKGWNDIRTLGPGLTDDEYTVLIESKCPTLQSIGNKSVSTLYCRTRTHANLKLWLGTKRCAEIKTLVTAKLAEVMPLLDIERTQQLPNAQDTDSVDTLVGIMLSDYTEVTEAEVRAYRALKVHTLRELKAVCAGHISQLTRVEQNIDTIQRKRADILLELVREKTKKQNGHLRTDEERSSPAAASALRAQKPREEYGDYQRRMREASERATAPNETIFLPAEKASGEQLAYAKLFDIRACPEFMDAAKGAAQGACTGEAGSACSSLFGTHEQALYSIGSRMWTAPYKYGVVMIPEEAIDEFLKHPVKTSGLSWKFDVDTPGGATKTVHSDFEIVGLGGKVEETMIDWSELRALLPLDTCAHGTGSDGSTTFETISRTKYEAMCADPKAKWIACAILKTSPASRAVIMANPTALHPYPSLITLDQNYFVSGKKLLYVDQGEPRFNTSNRYLFLEQRIEFLAQRLTSGEHVRGDTAILRPAEAAYHLTDIIAGAVLADAMHGIGDERVLKPWDKLWRIGNGRNFAPDGSPGWGKTKLIGAIQAKLVNDILNEPLGKRKRESADMAEYLGRADYGGGKDFRVFLDYVDKVSLDENKWAAIPDELARTRAEAVQIYDEIMAVKTPLVLAEMHDWFDKQIANDLGPKPAWIRSAMLSVSTDADDKVKAKARGHYVNNKGGFTGAAELNSFFPAALR